MKAYITLLPMKTGGYRVAESVDYRFAAITKLFGYDFRSGELLAWLDDEKQPSTTTEWVSIRKKDEKIVLYDLSPFFGDDTYSSINSMLEEAESFEMTIENFREVLEKWEELRTSRPDIILIVIHEDNHLSLEIDPSVIQQYQDAGYAFDSNKKQYLEVMANALNNFVEDVTELGNPNKKYLCRSTSKLFLEIIIDKNNSIISAYPSMKIFQELQ